MDNLKETKELFTFLFNIIEGVKTANEDGTLTITDIPAFFNALVSAPAAVNGANLLINELITATPEEKTVFYNWIADKFNINNEKIELYVENVFVHIVGIVTASAIAFKKETAATV